MAKELERIEVAISTFSEKMYEKMKKKWQEGFRGWEGEYDIRLMIKDLKKKVEQIENGDPSQCIDAANYLMMIDKILNKS